MCFYNKNVSAQKEMQYLEKSWIEDILRKEITEDLEKKAKKREYPIITSIWRIFLGRFFGTIHAIQAVEVQKRGIKKKVTVYIDPKKLESWKETIGYNTSPDAYNNPTKKCIKLLIHYICQQSEF